MPDEHDYDDIVDRLTGSGTRIRPRGDAVAVLDTAVARHRRRRATLAVVAVAATAVVASTVATVVVRAGDDDAPPVASSTDPSSDAGGTTKPPVTAARPAALFESVVDGRSRGRLIRFHLVDGERMHAVFDWWPAEGGGPGPYLAGVAVENVPDGTDCDTLVTGGTPCVERGDGDLLTTYDVPLTDATVDPVHRAAPVETTSPADPDARVLGVTYVHADGLAVSTYLCTCGPDGAVVTDDLPLTLADLEAVATAPEWVDRFTPGG